MPLEQLTYLGASITAVNSNIGWGTSPSTIQVDVVEDPANGDNFFNPGVGVVTYFEYGAIQMGGIITSIQTNNNNGGNPTYSVTIEDPRSILEGVQLIINGYTGFTYGVPNLYNIYGYLESLGFGRAGVNNSGIQWKNVRDGFLFLQNTTPIKFGTTNNLYLDLSQLPVLPDYYRISGDVITLMDFIVEICDASSHDFFFNLEQVSNNHVIKLYTINRSAQPTLGNISAFIALQDEVVSSNTGIELRNEVSSKFLIGGNKAQIYFQWPNLGDASIYTDDTIWPYWGVENSGDVIIGENGPMFNKHKFTLGSKGVDVIGIGDTYDTDIYEMRAALSSQESWELLLSSYNEDINSPHYHKATRIGMIHDVKDLSSFLAGKTIEKIEGLIPLDFTHLTGKVMTSATDSSVESIHEENQAALYSYVNNFANEYYGKKYQVRIPFVAAKLDDDTGEIVTTLEPTDGGYLDSIYWSGAVGNNLLPNNPYEVSLEDGRIHAYAKFDKFVDYPHPDSGKVTLDLSDLSADDYVVRLDTNSVFVKCTVQPQLQFLDKQLAYSPRAVIELPGRVTKKDKTKDTARFDGMFTSRFEEVLKGEKGFSDADATEVTKKVMARFGAEALKAGLAGMSVIPNMVAIPLKSNIDFYGPWYSIGVNGKTDFERDESLVPWNYGGFDLMNLTANARVSSALSQMQVGEGGSFTIPGVPIINMGAQLVAGGPNITDISVNISTGGITTTYKMQTWTPRLGKIPKQFSERLQKLKLNSAKMDKNFKSAKGADSYATREHHFDLKRTKREFFKGRPRRKSNSSTHQYLTGEVIFDGSGFTRTNVVTSPVYQISSSLGSGYEEKAVVSLDSIFTPFTMNPDSVSGLPHIELYEGSEVINGSSLNPFYNNNFGMVTRDYPDSDVDLTDADGDYKGIGLRGPLWVTGPGYDTNGEPVPGDGSGNFIEDYQRKIDLHKTGPVYLPWDNDRKMWIGGGSSIQLGIMNQNLLHRNSGLMSVWSYNPASGTEIESSRDIMVHDWFLPTGGVIWSGRRVGVTQISGRNYVIAAEPNC